MILPQAVRRVGPPLLNDFIALQKDVALISIIGVAGEAFRIAQIVRRADFNYTPLIAAALLYLAITLPLARLLDRWERERGKRTRERPGPRDSRRHQVVRRDEVLKGSTSRCASTRRSR